MAWGHPLKSIWAMTPRQMAAWVTLGAARTRTQMAAQLGIARTAAHGENADVQKLFREWDES